MVRLTPSKTNCDHPISPPEGANARSAHVHYARRRTLHDPREVDVSDIAAIFNDLDHPIREQDFDARDAARFEGVVQSINSGSGFPGILSFAAFDDGAAKLGATTVDGTASPFLSCRKSPALSCVDPWSCRRATAPRFI